VLRVSKGCGDFLRALYVYETTRGACCSGEHARLAKLSSGL